MAIKEYTNSQKKANELFGTGQNVLLTGKPGTGKTGLIEDYREKMSAFGKNVLVTASTGLAASNLTNGRTLHSALRWNPKEIDYNYEKCAELLRHTDILIIDEVSMLGAGIITHLVRCLECLDKVPQIVVSGDFFQLPPVYTSNEVRLYPFEVAGWKKLNLEPVVLTDIVRQKDPMFKLMLERAMLGDTSCISYFNSKTNQRMIDGAITLCTKNDYADYFNERALENLRGLSRKYEAQGDVSGADFKHSRVEKSLIVKPQMRVMALRNDPDGRYQNGSLGTVLDLSENAILVLFDNGETVNMQRVDYEIDKVKKSTDLAKVSQFPLRGGYAITIHKSQGQTFDSINIQAPVCWEAGQLYVALSRARTIKGIHLMNSLDSKSLITDPKVIRFYQSLLGTSYAA